MPAPEGLAAELSGIIREAQADRRLPSVSAAAVRDGEIVWSEAVGLADVEAGEEATPDHQYRIASITKTVTAVGVLRLRDEGRLSLDDRLAAHLEGAEHDLTIRGLLSHLSGLQREVPGEVWETLEMPTREELLPRLAEAERPLSPGAYWHYSNLAYALLGEVVARVSGQPAQDYLDETVLRPLGMSRTTWTAATPAAAGYLLDPFSDVPRREPVVDGRAIAPAAELWSTPTDLCRWAAFIADPRPSVLSPETVREMSTFQSMVDLARWRLGYGLGFALYRDGDDVYVGHDGAHAGFLAHVSAFPPKRTGAAVLTNEGAGVTISALGIELSRAVAAAYRPLKDEWRPGEAPPAELDGVLGRWWTEGHPVDFAYRGGRLESIFPESRLDLGRSVYEQVGEDVYRVVQGHERGELLRVVRGDDGVPVKLYFATYPVTRDPQTFGSAP
ncbi:MAG TPA: serine hydrolase domain-containing protein [Gaiellaceae bacterium]|nr:serine hydrolase domain-containing protein [Gaiellaceae bacterium]